MDVMQRVKFWFYDLCYFLLALAVFCNTALFVVNVCGISMSDVLTVYMNWMISIGMIPGVFLWFLSFKVWNKRDKQTKSLVILLIFMFVSPIYYYIKMRRRGWLLKDASASGASE